MIFFYSILRSDFKKVYKKQKIKATKISLTASINSKDQIAEKNNITINIKIKKL